MMWRSIRFVFACLGWIRRRIAWLLVVTLLVTNVLAFTSAAFVAMVSAGASAVGFTTVQAARTAQAVKRSAVVKRIAARTTRGAIRAAASVPVQVPPIAGAFAVLSFTAWEIYDACETLGDLAAIEDIDDAAEGRDLVCGMAYPSWDDLWREPTIETPDMPPPRL
jgi:hypothetical protein